MFGEFRDPRRILGHDLYLILKTLIAVEGKVDILMAAIDEAKDNLAALTADVQALLAQPKGVPEADVKAIADAIAALDATVKAALPVA